MVLRVLANVCYFKQQKWKGIGVRSDEQDGNLVEQAGEALILLKLKFSREAAPNCKVN